jgi:hypothetical protein
MNGHGFPQRKTVIRFWPACDREETDPLRTVRQNGNRRVSPIVPIVRDNSCIYNTCRNSALAPISLYLAQTEQKIGYHWYHAVKATFTLMCKVSCSGRNNVYYS